MINLPSGLAVAVAFLDTRSRRNFAVVYMSETEREICAGVATDIGLLAPATQGGAHHDWQFDYLRAHLAYAYVRGRMAGEREHR